MNKQPHMGLAQVLGRFIVALILTLPPNFLAIAAWWITSENGYSPRRTPVLGASYTLAGIISIFFVLGFTLKWRTTVVFILAWLAVAAWIGGMLSWRYL